MKEKWHVAGNVGYFQTTAPCYPTLRPPHVCNLNRSFTKPICASSITHSASNIWIQAHPNCDKCNSNCILQEFLFTCKNFDFCKTRKVPVHWTQLTLPVWRQSSVPSFLNCSTSLAYRGVSGITRLFWQSTSLLCVCVCVRACVRACVERERERDNILFLFLSNLSMSCQKAST